MRRALGEAAGVGSEAVETAFTWALYAAVAYAVLFVDLSGRGALGGHLMAIWREGKPAPAIPRPEGVRSITIGPPGPPQPDHGLNYSYLRQPGAERAVIAATPDNR